MEGPWRLSHREEDTVLGEGVFLIPFLETYFGGHMWGGVPPCCLPSILRVVCPMCFPMLSSFLLFFCLEILHKEFLSLFLMPKKKGFSTLLNLGDTKRGTYRRSLVSSRK